MKSVGLIIGAIFLVLVIFGAGLIFGYIGFSNDANKYEADIPAQYTQMKNVYDNGYKKVMETADIANNYADQVKSIYQDIMKGRYGSNGSQAMLQFIKEQNPNIDPSLLKKVQQQIETFHNDFESSQQNIIARKQAYQIFLTATTSGRFYNMVGSYPHIKCGVPAGSADDFQIVTSDKTETDFQNHKSEPLNLRQPAPVAPKKDTTTGGTEGGTKG